MALRRRGSQQDGLTAWPGYVDALSTLLMVIIFVLLVFVLAQAFLSVALSGRDQALDRLGKQMAEISDMLSLERGRSAELQLSISGLSRDLATSRSKSDALALQLAQSAQIQAALASERDALRDARDQLAARLADATLQVGSAQSRNAALQQQLSDIARRGDDASQNSVASIAQLADAKQQLASTQALLDEMKKQAAANDREIQADRATITARLSDLAQLTQQVQALTALRNELEQQAKDAAARAMTEADRNKATALQLTDEKRLGDSARAQVALLNQQMEQLRLQMASISKALDVSETSAKDKDVQIANLGSRLNAALAQKVEELQRYRSEFFGKLSQVLANRPGITVVGDRFVFQSEVLFPVGSADLSASGQDQIIQLATTLKTIGAEIPKDVNWMLRVDGHADRQPITGRFASNWELSASRAITVVKLLVAEGIPANRLAATGFGDNQPLDPADTPEAYARNRRIELRLTDR
jgi:chemotaxis protein MotB